LFPTGNSNSREDSLIIVLNSPVEQLKLFTIVAPVVLLICPIFPCIKIPCFASFAFMSASLFSGLFLLPQKIRKQPDLMIFYELMNLTYQAQDFKA